MITITVRIDIIGNMFSRCISRIIIGIITSITIINIIRIRIRSRDRLSSNRRRSRIRSRIRINRSIHINSICTSINRVSRVRSYRNRIINIIVNSRQCNRNVPYHY